LLDEFSDHHTEYAHTVCWLRGTYYLPTDESLLYIMIFSRLHRFFDFSYHSWSIKTTNLFYV